MEWLSRTELLLGKDSVDRLKNKRVIVFGVGGVGGYVCEALARSGVGYIDIVDNDTVSLSNINRQIIALNSTVGQYKVDVMEKRMKDINPDITVQSYNLFYTPDTEGELDLSGYDYIVDAIDTVSGKISLAVRAEALGIKIISSMGAGNKLDPTAFRVADIYKTSVCPLARAMRTELKKRGVKSLKAVYSEEKAISPDYPEEMRALKKLPPASCAFIPSVVGLIVASEVIKDLISMSRNEIEGIRP
ncbi:MAG: tRNA threonylcarbamoyladenosine dehydratase [Clostridia bacterium]|nr:tRNA threonylcarbamoyladenosine dehydratase [Clostridia bacterium]